MQGRSQVLCTLFLRFVLLEKAVVVQGEHGTIGNREAVKGG
jgi:hypothetical protein